MKILDITRFEGVPLVDESSCIIPFQSSPHIHVHLLLSDAEAKQENFSLQEVCCHACGAALFIKVSWDALMMEGGDATNMMAIYGEDFVREHAKCIDNPVEVNGVTPTAEDFNYICPDFRSDELYTMDLDEEL